MLGKETRPTILCVLTFNSILIEKLLWKRSLSISDGEQRKRNKIPVLQDRVVCHVVTGTMQLGSHLRLHGDEFQDQGRIHSTFLLPCRRDGNVSCPRWAGQPPAAAEERVGPERLGTANWENTPCLRTSTCPLRSSSPQHLLQCSLHLRPKCNTLKRGRKF